MMDDMETLKPIPSLRLVDKTSVGTHGPWANEEYLGGPLIACGGIAQPYRVFRLVKNAAPTAEPVFPDSSERS